jgi:Collagen triple helix repeat (20 copies)
MFEIYRKVISCLGLISVICLYGCGGSESSPNLAIAIAVLNSAPITACPSGGITIQSGVDANGDQVLNALEASNEQYICNGVNGAIGAQSLSPLISVNPEPIGVNCTSGGSQVNVGLDASRNSILDHSEITSVSYVCNGYVGSNGANGVTGVVGATGSNGTAGAVGATGTAGTNGTNGSDGTNGANGNDGARGSIGIPGNDGNDGHNSLVSIVSLAIGDANCPNGGLKINYGLDTDNDSILDAEEMSVAKYTCNGENGRDGVDGTNAPVQVIAYAYLYDLVEQVVRVSGGLVFEGGSDIHKGITHEGEEIRFEFTGIYAVSFSISPNSICEFALEVGGEILPQTVQGFDAGSQQNSGQMIIKISSTERLRVVNYGTSSVTLHKKSDRELINS